MAASIAIGTLLLALSAPGGDDAAAGSLHEIKVVVVDRDGRPVPGVPVGITSPDSPFEAWIGERFVGEPTWPVQETTTAGDGTATFRELMFQEFRSYAHDVVLAFPHPEDVRVHLPAGHASREPIRLVMPPTRQVVAEFVDDAGRQVEGIGHVTIRLVHPADSDKDAGACRTTVVLSSGLVQLPFVGHGRLEIHGNVGTCEIHTNRDYPRAGDGSIEVVADDGRTTRVRVRAGSPGPELSGALKWPDGTDASDQEVSIFEHPFDTSRTFCGPPPLVARTRCDERGRFRARVRPLTSGSWFSIAVLDEFGAARFAVAVPCARTDADTIRIGSVALTAATRLVAGRIVGSAPPAQPFHESLRVHFEQREPPDESRPSDRSRWSLGSLPQCRTWLADGRFDVRTFATPAAADVEVHVSGSFIEGRGGWKPPRVPIGTRELSITLHPLGAIATRLVLPEDASSSAISVATTLPGAEVARNAFSQPPAFADEIELRQLPPRALDFVVGTRDSLPSRVEFVRIGGIEVPAGGIASDPRLAKVDLSGHLVVRDLEWVGADGTPAGDGVLYGEALDRSLVGVELPIRSGRCRVPVVRALEAKVCGVAVVRGFAAKRITGADLTHPIVLERGPTLRMTIAPWPLPAPCEVVLSGSVASSEGDSSAVRWRVEVASGIAGGATVDLPIPCAGSWFPRVVVRPSRNGEALPLEFIRTPSNVEVRAGETTTEATIRLTPAQVEEIAKFQSRFGR